MENFRLRTSINRIQSNGSIDRYTEILREARQRGYNGVNELYIGILLAFLTPEKIREAEDIALTYLKENYPASGKDNE